MFLDGDQVGQAFNDLAALNDNVLKELLPGHGFPAESAQALRNGDRAGLIRTRLDTLVDGELNFMRAQNVNLPTKRTAATIADSDTSDEDE